MNINQLCEEIYNECLKKNGKREASLYNIEQLVRAYFYSETDKLKLIEKIASQAFNKASAQPVYFGDQELTINRVVAKR